MSWVESIGLKSIIWYMREDKFLTDWDNDVNDWWVNPRLKNKANELWDELIGWGLMSIESCEEYWAPN